MHVGVAGGNLDILMTFPTRSAILQVSVVAPTVLGVSQENNMSDKAGSPFESIESAHEFVTLLAATVGEAKRDVEADVQRESGVDSPRRLEALRTALYSMEKLEQHMNQSRRILNDLRSLRRLLFDERSARAISKSLPAGVIDRRDVTDTKIASNANR